MGDVILHLFVEKGLILDLRYKYTFLPFDVTLKNEDCAVYVYLMLTLAQFWIIRCYERLLMLIFGCRCGCYGFADKNKLANRNYRYR